MRRAAVLRRSADEAKRIGVHRRLVRESASHAVYELADVMIPIPRHAELDDRFVRTRIFRKCEAVFDEDWWRR